MTVCTNCGTELLGPYCHACGQKEFVEQDRGFAHLLQQFLHSATDVDGRIWRSLRALLCQPGLLSREYIEGRRARWISPASLFFAISVIYFLAPLHGGDFSQHFDKQVPGKLRALARAPGDEPLTAEQLASSGQLHSPFTAPWIERRVAERDAAARKKSDGATGYGYHDYRLAYDAKADDVSKALVMLHVPFAALALMALFARRGRYFAEHFVVALHFFAFALAALEVVAQLSGALQHLPPAWRPSGEIYDWFMRALFPAYAIVALRRAYRVGWLHALVGAAGMLAVIWSVNLVVYRAVQFGVTFWLT